MDREQYSAESSVNSNDEEEEVDDDDPVMASCLLGLITK
jgi:hypothetical protein